MLAAQVRLIDTMLTQVAPEHIAINGDGSPDEIVKRSG